jgi:type 1 glutamine amidotransferase
MALRNAASWLTGMCAAALYLSAPSAEKAQQAPAPQAPTGQPGPAGQQGRGGFGRGGPQNQTPNPADVQAMMAALPDKAPAKPKHPRNVLVLAKAAGFVHSSIPLAAATVEALGRKTGAWNTTVSYEAGVITADNLKQYDLLFLASTTGAFLDDPNDQAVTDARKKALLDFVRGGKGLAGIHAASDSYHTSGGGRGRGAAGAPGAPDGSANAGAPAAPTPGPSAPVGPLGTWPDFNNLIGGYFKFHWVYPQLITVKIDDPKSPLTAMFHGEGFEIHDETYTFAQNSFSRQNVHVLTSVDYSKMSEEDKAKEPAATKRTDGDYALSWIRREGKGRVFYEAHGHSEKIYAIAPMLQHVLAGTQYALGDLPADDSPSVKPAKK